MSELPKQSHKASPPSPQSESPRISLEQFSPDEGAGEFSFCCAVLVCCAILYDGPCLRWPTRLPSF